MELTYIYAESAVRPAEIEVGLTTVYLRRNFVEMQRQRMEGKSEIVWTYEEAQMSKDEALLLLTEQQSVIGQDIADADAMNIDHELRLTMLELGLSDADT